MKYLLYLLGVIFTLLIFLIPQNVVFAEQSSNKRIEVDLSRQSLNAYQDNTLIYSFPISSGTLAHPTVTGTFYPWAKLRFTRMIGGSKALGDYYDLPNVPYVVYFYKGYAIHGTYWHNNFGHPMSHGCVNVSTSNMASLYNFIDYQTPIIISGSTPTS